MNKHPLTIVGQMTTAKAPCLSIAPSSRNRRSSSRETVLQTATAGASHSRQGHYGDIILDHFGDESQIRVSVSGCPMFGTLYTGPSYRHFVSVSTGLETVWFLGTVLVSAFMIRLIPIIWTLSRLERPSSPWARLRAAMVLFLFLPNWPVKQTTSNGGLRVQRTVQ